MAAQLLGSLMAAQLLGPLMAAQLLGSANNCHFLKTADESLPPELHLFWVIDKLFRTCTYLLHACLCYIILKTECHAVHEQVYYKAIGIHESVSISSALKLLAFCKASDHG